MSIADHLDSLKRKHGALEDEIAVVTARPMPDQSKVTKLKRKKLRLKEQIEQIQSVSDNGTRH